MRAGTRELLTKIGRRATAVALATAFIVAGARASAVPLVNPSFFGQANTTYQEWDGFTSPTGPNPATHVNNPYGTPTWVDTTANTDDAFIIGTPPAAHIYSFDAILNLQATVPAPTLSSGATTTIVFQAEVLGSALDQTLFGVSLAGLMGSPLQPTQITQVDEGVASGGFGGGDFYYRVEWDNVPAASSYTLTYVAGDTSSSQVSARIDTLTTVPTTSLTGDVNNDGIVNGQDLALVSSSWLQAGANLASDVNHDGIVNAQDIALVSSNWLHTSGAGAQAAAVPEPSTIALLGVGLLALLARRQMRATRARNFIG
ncbi:MAG TPA: dockerin type I domain-containing protein [Pirellulales bacterium]|jgi:hypothetical protein